MNRGLGGNCTGIVRELHGNPNGNEEAFQSYLQSILWLPYVFVEQYGMDNNNVVVHSTNPIDHVRVRSSNLTKEEDSLCSCVVGGRRKAPDTQYNIPNIPNSIKSHLAASDLTQMQMQRPMQRPMQSSVLESLRVNNNNIYGCYYDFPLSLSPRASSATLPSFA